MQCERFVKYALPAIRALVARYLIEEKNMSQTEVASFLGVSQASISQYLSSKRGKKLVKEISSVPEIKTTINKLAEMLVNKNYSEEEKSKAVCSVCKLVGEKIFSI
ncbi:MAG: helix-turn-helix domain-containing protein [Candidatus Brockarchaeota archaeon]|nr:helix-turn-helix domain-containing protein [Candidatus Brockarchaeota archaeon]